MSFETLFVFKSPSCCLTEIKLTDISDNEPKDKIYHWLWIDPDSNVKKLKFVNMSVEDETQKRVFEDATLEFDDLRAEIAFTNDESFTLEKANQLNSSQIDDINNFISNLI